MGGLIGIFIGVDLWVDRENLEDKFHGKVIMAIGIVAFIMYILL